MTGYVVSPAFYPLFVKASGFRADDRRSGCGKCGKLCPLNNIQREEDCPL